MFIFCEISYEKCKLAIKVSVDEILSHLILINFKYNVKKVSGKKAIQMKISIIGTGYVGLSTGIGLASLGNDIVCVDIDEEKINSLNKGIISIYEPGLKEQLPKLLSSKNISFSTDYSQIRDSEFVFVAVGTPTDISTGLPNLKFLDSAINYLENFVKKGSVIILKSTVPPKTNKDLSEKLSKKGLFVISNPEFLKEGSALSDFLTPDRIIIGSDGSKEVINKVMVLYDYFIKKGVQIIFTDFQSAEMIKYASNAMLALRISFINEISQLCDKFKANIKDVAKGIGSDKRIGTSFLNAGLGFGGSCFPKDVLALHSLGVQQGLNMQITKSILEVNSCQLRYFAQKIIDYFDKLDIEKPCLSVLGLAFKPQTDDIRESKAIELITILKDKGFNIKAYDPKAIKNTIEEKGADFVQFCDFSDVFEGCDGIILATEWAEFVNLDFSLISQKLRHKVLFDGRNVFSKAKLEKLGFEYIGIGI